jgi:hypothetical protein
VGLTWVEALLVGFPFNLLVHTMGGECLNSLFQLAGAVMRGGRRWRFWTTVQSSAKITFSKGNVDGGRTGILRPAALRSDGGHAGLIAGDETPAMIPDDSSRTRPHARSLVICDDFLRQRLSARFSMDDDRDLGEAGEGEYR